MRTAKEILNDELNRQNNEINLIASENYCSEYILECCGHPIQNKYSEGFEGARYYQGCEFVDEIEHNCKELACKLYHGKYACVQPHSGSSANLTVYEAATKYWNCEPKDIVGIGAKLSCFGHLTHFSKPSISGKQFESHQYGLDKNELINYDEIEQLLFQYKNRNVILVVGMSAYSRIIDYNRIAEAVKKSRKETDKEIVLLFDISHPSALVVTGEYQNPMDIDFGQKTIKVLTTTIHKTMRGARHAIILTNDKEFANKINIACFPFLQGGQITNMTAGVLAALEEANKPEFKVYTKQIIKNMKALITGIKSMDLEQKLRFVSGGSDTHLVLIDLKNSGLTGKEAETLLKQYHIVCNMNAIPGDTDSKNPSGIRIGTAAITTRGFDENMCYELGKCIARILLNSHFFTKDGTIDFEEFEIKTKLKKMMDKVGPFYGRKQQIQDNNLINPDDLA